MNNIMIDIETLGTNPGCAILSIAAVRFDPDTGAIGEKFLVTIDLNSCDDAGLNIEPNTFNWWLSQSKEAQEAYLLADKTTLCRALNGLNGFITRFDYVWGNSARFDLGILQAAYDAVRMNIPWDYKREMDFRTLTNLFPDIKAAFNHTGVAHNPLDDCLNQIAILHQCYKILQS